jgi:hypothetical protein
MLQAFPDSWMGNKQETSSKTFSGFWHELHPNGENVSGIIASVERF